MEPMIDEMHGGRSHPTSHPMGLQITKKV